MADSEAKDSKGKRKASISEEDMQALLQRYSVTTVLTLLQEVANSPGVSIDWDALAQKTSTGISNAREYQILWRHLAYRHSLIGKLEDDAEPLDDDSDLDFELEAAPVISAEASAEAVACVKVLIGSGLPSEFIVPNILTETPLTINVPNGQSTKGRIESSQASPSMSGMNIAAPISVQNPPLSAATPFGGLDGNQPQKKKRKVWSKAEDLELIAAVQKYGEGNWATILKGDFKGDRTASQLSQRWALIRKKQKNTNVSVSLTGTQLSEARQAAHHAMNLAIGKHDRILPTGIGNKQTPNQSQPTFMPPKPSPVGNHSSMAKPGVSIKRPLLKPHTDSDSNGLQAAAVAAGARIATPSDAKSLMMAAQAKKPVHVVTSAGGSVITRAISGGSAISGAFPNVHHIRTGLSSPPLSSQAVATRKSLPKPASDTVQSTTAIATAAPSVYANPFEPSKSPPDQEAIVSKNEREIPEPVIVPKEQCQETVLCVLDDHTSPQAEASTASQEHTETAAPMDVDEEPGQGESLDPEKTTICSEAPKIEIQTTAEKIPEKANVDGKPGDDSPGLAIGREASEVQAVS